MILVPLFDLNFLRRVRARRCQEFRARELLARFQARRKRSLRK